jgi:hypothetical protein
MHTYSEGAALFGSAAVIKDSIYHKAKVMSPEMFEKFPKLDSYLNAMLS